jgi:hypothetical protein
MIILHPGRLWNSSKILDWVLDPPSIMPVQGVKSKHFMFTSQQLQVHRLAILLLTYLDTCMA